MSDETGIVDLATDNLEIDDELEPALVGFAVLGDDLEIGLDYLKILANLSRR
jgi:hypothetical protein